MCDKFFELACKSTHMASSKPAAGGAEAEEEEKRGLNDGFAVYYGQLPHQQTMLQDEIRTGTYERAIMANAADFKGKVVLDVGTGTGLLAYFAAKAGARKVYAVEASEVAEVARELMQANGVGHIVEVIHAKMEDIEPPEQVDVIISEPMGFVLVHERMLETYVAAREKWLKPGGLMMPTVGRIYCSPFTDAALHEEQLSKSAFWETRNFHGLDLSCLKERATKSYFAQPVVGYFEPSILLSEEYATHDVDFMTIDPEGFHDFEIALDFGVEKTALCHGIGLWFDVGFNGSSQKVPLTTAPHAHGTHWYQCRFMLQEPIAVNRSQRLTGKLHFTVSEKSSYMVAMEVRLDGTEVVATNTIDLADQFYHYLQQPAANYFDQAQQDQYSQPAQAWS